MIFNIDWCTTAALTWLQAILFERFGHAFFLQDTGAQSVRLAYPGNSAAIELALNADTFSRTDSDLPCTIWNASIEGWDTAIAPKLPAPGSTSLPSPLIKQTATGFSIHYDILGLAYWMLSRQEEVGRTDLDEHGRFPATASHAYKHGYLERPIVDEWLHILGQVIQRTWPGIELKQHTFNMKVSHDVDGPSRYGFRSARGLVRAMAGDVLKRLDFKSAVLAPWVRMNSKAALHPADPANTFDWIMDVSEQHGLKSAFYFICGRTDASKDADYEPEHPAIRHLMRSIHARGHEIGLHPSYGSYQTTEIIVAEAARLKRIAQEEGISQSEWGGRMHYLRWEQPTTLQAWEQAGMSYDSTLGYADRPGFRCGTCFEYPAFDPVRCESLRLRIRPLIVMECTVISSSYMGLGCGKIALSKFAELKFTCKKVNGVFNLLWHNSQLLDDENKYLYSYLIAS